MEEDSPMQRMKDSYNRVESEREVPKLKLIWGKELSVVMRNTWELYFKGGLPNGIALSNYLQEFQHGSLCHFQDID